MNSIAPENRANPPDSLLADRVAAGDIDALEMIMRRYNQSLYRAARSILKNEQDAEEAVQDAYLKAYNAIADFRGHAKLSTWLTRIVINEALTRQRKHNRRAEIIPMVDDAPVSNLPSESTHMAHKATSSPEQNAQRAEVRRMIERNIDKLPDSFRSVFVLRALEEMTVSETANCLNIPEATVRSRYFRARGLMREAIAREIDLNYEDAFCFAGTRCDRIVRSVLTRLPKTNNR